MDIFNASSTSLGLQCELDLRMKRMAPTFDTKQTNTEKVAKAQKEYRYCEILFLWCQCFSVFEKKMVPCKSTAGEVSFEWSHHRISSTDPKVTITLHVSIIELKLKLHIAYIMLKLMEITMIAILTTIVSYNYKYYKL